MRDCNGHELQVGDRVEHCQGVKGIITDVWPYQVKADGDDGNFYSFVVPEHITMVSRGPQLLEPYEPYGGWQAIEADDHRPHVMGLDPEIIDQAAYRAFMRDLQT